VRRKGRVVALVAMATDFIPYGKASYARSDVAGRPGLNPLRVSGGKPAIIVTERMRRRLEPLARIGLRLRTGNHFGIRWGFKIDPDHLEGNLKAISEAASKADIVVASVHAHRQGPWLQKIARYSIERGASLVFIHGPHEIRGIEIFNGRPVFYAMSDFVFEPEYIARFPAEAYEKRGLPPDAVLDETTRAKLASPLLRKRKSFEAFAALIGFTGPEVARIGLIPLDLQFDAIGESRGRPQLASPQLGREIIGRLATRSKRFGTRIVYDADSNRGEVAMD
jgi:poly-gamma-glutamate synthesis protein (capsule biosynthesis protein)